MGSPRRSASSRRTRGSATFVAIVLAVGSFAATPAGAAPSHGWTRAWGSNATGQLGTSGASSGVPVDVGGAAGLSRIAGVDAGGGHSLAVGIGGQVYSWGRNLFGQLGNGTLGPNTDRPSPAVVAGLPSAVAVAAGEEHSLALAANGDVYAWGNNLSAQLALNPQTIGASPVPVRVQGLPASDPIVAIAAGQAHSLALTQSGRVWAWGSNLSGQLGTGTLSTVEPVPAPVQGLSGVAAIASGTTHSLAVAGAAGRVFAWGNNSNRQLNDPDTVGRSNPVPFDTGVTGASAVAGGAIHSLARLSDGTVSSWGGNASGQLGRGNGATPAPVQSLANVTAVAAGASHSIAIVGAGNEGHVYTWGANGSGQLGTGGIGGSSSVPARVASFTTAIRIAGGDAHTLAVAAPRAIVDTTSVEFPGVVEVGNTVGPVPVRLTNQGPGPLTIGSVAVQEGNPDFALAANPCANSTLAAGDGCTVSIVFSPQQPGPRVSFVRFQQDGYDGPIDVTLSGTASIIAGGLPQVTTDPSNLTTGVPASPARVPLDLIPIQPGSPAMRDAEAAGELPLNDLAVTDGELPLNDLAVTDGELPLNDLAVTDGELPLNDLAVTDELPLNDLAVAGPLAAAVLRQIPLNTVPLIAPYKWDGPAGDVPTPVLAGSALAGVPLQELTLFQVVADPVARENFASIPIRKVRWTASKLAGLGFFGLLLGKTPLSDIVVPPALSAQDSWCPGLNEALGTSDCARAYGRHPDNDADGLTSSAMEMQLAGIPFGAIPLATVRLGDVTPASDAPYLGIPITSIDLYRSDLGSVLLSAIPAATRARVVDCARTTCSGDTTLFDAHGAQALQPGGTIGDLGAAIDGFTLARLAFGLLPIDVDPYASIPLTRLGILPYAGNGASKLTYYVNFTPTAELPDGSAVSVTLPSEQFTYVPGSTALTVDGGDGTTDGPTLSGRTLTWKITSRVAAGAVMLLRFDARPGFRLGTYLVPSVSIDGAHGSIRNTTPSAPVRVIEANEGGTRPANDTLASATPIAPNLPGQAGDLVVSHIARAGDVDVFTFTADPAVIPAGSEITVTAEHLAADADLGLYYPAGAEIEAPLRALTGTGSLVPMRDAELRVNDDAASVEGNAQSDIPVLTGLPLAGLSQNRGLRGEVVTALAVPAGPDDVYAVVVSGYQGEFSADPYSLRVSVSTPPTLPACTPRAFASGAPSTTTNLPAPGAFDGVQTLYLTAPGRLHRTYGATGAAAVADALDRVVADQALSDNVGRSAVLRVDANDPGVPQTAVQAAFASWDSDPCDPLKANDVVRAITALVDRLVPGGGSLRDVVLVGDDDIIPMGRVPDLTVRASERGYAGELASFTSANNPLVGAAAAGRILTDDAYGLPQTLRLPARYLYVPTAGLGRLIRTPAQIAGALDTFRTFRGIVDPKTALTTSAAPFLDDLARAVDAELSAKLGGQQETLIDGEWGLQQLRDSITNRADAPDIISLNGHSDPSRTLPKNARAVADLFTTADILNAPALTGGLAFAIGCHSALPLSAAVTIPSRAPDWAEAFAAKGAAGYIGQSGYGLASNSRIALSEKVLLQFSRYLGRLPLGRALAQAKIDYLSSVGALDVFDEKVLMEATFYGIPSFRTPNTPPDTYTPPSLPVAIDPATGLESVSLVRQSTDPGAAGYFALQQHDTAEGTYWSANGETLVSSGRPIQPLLGVDVTRTGAIAHGVLVTDLVSDDATGSSVDPVIARAVTTAENVEDPEPQPGDLVFPSAIQSLRSVVGPGGRRDHALLIPGAFISTGKSGGVTVGQQRLFRRIGFKVLYAPPNATDFTPPVISSAAGMIVGSVATFVVEARDLVPDDGTVKRVVVVYREEGSGVWRTLDLVQSPDPANRARWTGGAPVSAARVEFFASAVDASGNVATTARKGRFLEAVPPPPAEGDLDVALTGDESPAGGWFTRARLTLTPPAGESVVISYRVDGGAHTVYTGPVEFAGDGIAPPPGATVGDGYHTVEYTASNGARGTVLVPVDNRGPGALVASPRADGGSVFGLNQPGTLRFSCADSASGLALVAGCTATVDGVPAADGSALPTGQAGTHTVVVTGRDAAGHVSTTTVTYRVGFRFEGFLSPIKNRPATNKYNAGQNIPVKWRIFDADGRQITDLSTVKSVGSFQINCQTPPPVSPIPGDPTTGNGGPFYASDHFQYNWKTVGGTPPAGWQGTCRRFVLILSDESVHAADFAFS